MIRLLPLRAIFTEGGYVKEQLCDKGDQISSERKSAPKFRDIFLIQIL